MDALIPYEPDAPASGFRRRIIHPLAGASGSYRASNDPQVPSIALVTDQLVSLGQGRWSNQTFRLSNVPDPGGVYELIRSLALGGRGVKSTLPERAGTASSGRWMTEFRVASPIDDHPGP